MVSKNPNLQDGFYLEPNGMALPGFGPVAAASTTSSSEDPSKKIRKPYTITKSRESWTEPEHDKFLEALQLFDRDWKKIKAFVGSKSVIQVQKNGTNEHLPPPRPKRKAAYPYPQKATKNAPMLSQPPGSFQSSTALIEPGFVQRPDSTSMPMNPTTSAAAASWSNNLPAVSLSNQTKVAANNCCIGTESAPRTKQIGETAELENHGHPLRVLPDFAQVYSFIGSVFDPNATNHLYRLKKMDTIDVETVLLLMRNLSINLTSPDFEDHRRLLSSYEIDTEAIVANDTEAIVANKTLKDNLPKNVAQFG
ncbi:protein REVEILLE 6 isoform X2 [Hevea brasiliensis]|uniref:protein REVEILLE 6 isoform X2 n=1 Tax=Hevea brasiliensis TaxID=3981 RepID=UPI0025FD12D6|nr:protein REVEILLE 6 isoform X2 [Hevea brasiliensis]